MRVARLEITRFRGFESFVLVPRGSVVVVGEPRAGRSDLIAALRRVLDPRSVQARPSEWDVFRPLPELTELDGDGDAEVAIPLTSVKVSLMSLSPEVEQDLDDRLELLDPETGEVADPAAADDAELGIRLTYCLRYGADEQQLEHWLEYAKSGQRVPRADREALRAFILERNPPLQLRSEGILRRLASEPNPDALAATLLSFAEAITEATTTLTRSDEVQAGLKLVVNHGPKRLLELDDTDPTVGIGFTAEDGSMAALLRAVQPTLDLDEHAGNLPLSSHGSTTAAVLATAEASAVAQTDHAIVLADDFGDQLDAAAAEYLAARLRRRGGQLWLTTRRAEVISAFDATDLVRLTRHTGARQHFQLSENADRKERARRRHVSTLLAPAMSARTVILLEGPHDFETYTTVERRRFQELAKTPVSALGMRFVTASASGGEGGKQELAKLARLAKDFGLSIRVVLDHDKPGSDADLLEELKTMADLIVRLPPRAAVERAIVDGLEPVVLRSVLETLNDDHDLGLDVKAIDDGDLADRCIKALKQKGGLHRLFIELLPYKTVPQLASNVLIRLHGAAPADPLVILADL